MSSRPDLGPKPLLGYTASILARVAERRTDDAFLAACAADAKAGTFAIGGELVVMRRTANGPDPLFPAEEARALAPVAETVFLDYFCNGFAQTLDGSRAIEIGAGLEWVFPFELK